MVTSSLHGSIVYSGNLAKVRREMGRGIDPRLIIAVR
jgi:hypothetical protein